MERLVSDGGDVEVATVVVMVVAGDCRTLLVLKLVLPSMRLAAMRTFMSMTLAIEKRTTVAMIATATCRVGSPRLDRHGDLDGDE